MRQRPNHLPIAISNTTGRLLEDSHDIDPNLNWGPRGTLGYYLDNQAVEVTGFWIGDNHKTVSANGPLAVPFSNPPGNFGFDPLLFQRAAFAQTTLTHSVGSAELNYRSFDRLGSGAEVLFGVRYLDVQEKLAILTEDAGSVPTGQATDFTRTHNYIIAPQLGFDFNQSIKRWLTLGATLKGAWGVNLVEEDTELKNGTQTIQRSAHQSFTNFGQVYEIDAYLECWLWERCRVKGGYTALWALGVSDVNAGVNFNLSDPQGHQSHDGSIFYHGPMVEVELLF
jgi:hypothetical protein